MVGISNAVEAVVASLTPAERTTIDEAPTPSSPVGGGPSVGNAIAAAVADKTKDLLKSLLNLSVVAASSKEKRSFFGDLHRVAETLRKIGLTRQQVMKSKKSRL